jgi:hypothetical protein
MENVLVCNKLYYMMHWLHIVLVCNNMNKDEIVMHMTVFFKGVRHELLVERH